MKTNKIIGVLMAVLMVASAVALVSARPVPNDCISVAAFNYVPEEVNVTSYYGDGTVKESFIIPAHDEFGAADVVQIHVPKNGKIGVNEVDFLPAQNEEDKYLKSRAIEYINDDSNPNSRDAGKKIGFW
ncbi:MAG: hypothetical protein CfClM3_0510 [Methanobrevibacter sp. CfCl-M3]